MAKKSTPTAALSAEHRIVVLVGDDTFQATEKLAQLRAAIEKAHGEADTLRFDGQSAPLADVLDECRTVGLMAQHKLVVVDRGEQLIKEDNRPLMERYAQAPAEGATLVLRCERWFKGKLDDMIHAVGVIVDLASAAPANPAEWAAKRAASHHRATLAPDAARLLVQKLGDDLGRIDTELEKLATYASAPRASTAPSDAPAELLPVAPPPRGQAHASPDTPTITAAMVAEMVGLTREEEAWGLQSTLLAGTTAAALRHLRVILDNSRKDAAVPLSWACMDLCRKLHSASHALKQGENPWQLAGKLKLWGPAKDAVMATASRLPPYVAASLLHAAVDADHRAKTGLGDFDRNLERLVVRVTQALRG